MENVLSHHGIKGQKWGVRRFRNKDGSLTPTGKKRYSEGADANAKNRNHDVAKKVAIGAGAALTVAAAATIYATNKETVDSIVSKVGKTTVSSLKTAGRKTVEVGKTYVREACAGVKDGVKAGIREAPKKAAQAVITGVIMNATKRALDASVGKEEAARIFQANNNKKISSFWKVSSEDKDDDD